MLLTPENAFLGAKIKKDDAELYVIKVNAKSFYAAPIPYEQFLEGYQNQTWHKETFTNYCKRLNYPQCKYGEYEITEDELKKKMFAPSKSPSAVKEKKLLSDSVINLVKDTVKDLKKKKRNVLCITVWDSSTRVVIVEEHNTSYCLNVGNTYYLYNMSTEKIIRLCTVAESKLSSKTMDWSIIEEEIPVKIETAAPLDKVAKAA